MSDLNSSDIFRLQKDKDNIKQHLEVIADGLNLMDLNQEAQMVMGFDDWAANLREAKNAEIIANGVIGSGIGEAISKGGPGVEKVAQAWDVNNDVDSMTGVVSQGLRFNSLAQDDKSAQIAAVNDIDWNSLENAYRKHQAEFALSGNGEPDLVFHSGYLDADEDGLTKSLREFQAGSIERSIELADLADSEGKNLEYLEKIKEIEAMGMKLHEPGMDSPLFHVKTAKGVDGIMLNGDVGGRGLDINHRDLNGQTAVHLNHSFEALKELHKNGLKLDAQDRDGQTVLFSEKEPEKIRFYLENGVDAGLRRHDGKTALEVNPAIEPIREEVDRINKQIQANDFEEKRSLALRSVKSDDLEKIKELHKGGFPLDRVVLDGKNGPEVGQTLLFVARSKEMAQYLKEEAGVDHLSKDLGGVTALHVVPKAVGQYLVDDLRMNVDTVDHNNNTPLLYASAKGDIEKVNYLLDSGANFRAQNIHGKNALMVAADKNSAQIVSSILDRDEHGRTLLATDNAGNLGASFAKNKDAAKVMEEKLDEVKMKLGMFPEEKKQLAPYTGVLELELAKRLCSSYNASHFIRKHRDGLERKSGEIEAIVGSKEHERGKIACARGEVEELKKSISAGLDPNSKDLKGNTLLHDLACAETNPGRMDCVKLLLRAGADINTKDSLGRTALHLCKDPSLQSLLLNQANVDINAQDVKGNTPLHYACAQESSELVTALMEKGADIKIQNEYGQDALHFAVSGNKGELVDYIAAHEPQMINNKDMAGNRGIDYSDHQELDNSSGERVIKNPGSVTEFRVNDKTEEIQAQTYNGLELIKRGKALEGEEKIVAINSLRENVKERVNQGVEAVNSVGGQKVQKLRDHLDMETRKFETMLGGDRKTLRKVEKTLYKDFLKDLRVVQKTMNQEGKKIEHSGMKMEKQIRKELVRESKKLVQETISARKGVDPISTVRSEQKNHRKNVEQDIKDIAQELKSVKKLGGGAIIPKRSRDNGGMELG